MARGCRRPAAFAEPPWTALRYGSGVPLPEGTNGRAPRGTIGDATHAAPRQVFDGVVAPYKRGINPVGDDGHFFFVLFERLRSPLSGVDAAESRFSRSWT